MPKPYSFDLRERVVRFVDEGHSRHATAAHFRVSVSFVVNLVKAFRVRGSLAPKGVVTLPREERERTIRGTDFHAAATTSRHVLIAAARSTRCD